MSLAADIGKLRTAQNKGAADFAKLAHNFF
jgi:hypothetical protein